MPLIIRNTAGEPASIDLYGVVGDWSGIVSDDVRAYLANVKDTDEITVHLNTPGGSYREGITIYNNFKRRKGAVHMVVDSEAHSAGSLISQAGTTITMLNGSWMMIHEAHGEIAGRADDLREAAAVLDSVNTQIVDIYKPRWKGSESELRAALAKETWMSDSDAVKSGLADKTAKAMAIAARADLSKFNYKNVPQQLLVEVKQIDPTDEIIEEIDRELAANHPK